MHVTLSKCFVKKVNTRMQRYSRSFRTDQAGEFAHGDLEAYFKENGVTHRASAACSAESNVVAEPHNETLSAIVRPALEHAPPSFCAETYNWACYIKHRLPHSTLNSITPYDGLYNAKPAISHLRPISTKCYAHIDNEIRLSGSKLGPRSSTGPLVSYRD